MEEQEESFQQKASLYNKLGLNFARQSKWEEAVKEYEKAIELCPASARLYINLGKAYENLGRLDLAIEHWQKALVLEPTRASSHYEKEEEITEITEIKNDDVPAQKEIKITEEEAQNLNREKAIELFKEGMKHFENREFEESITKLEEALELYPELSEVHLNLGTALKEINRLDKAKYHYKKAIELSPLDPVAHYNLGLLYYQEKDYSSSCEEYQKALLICPTDILSIYNLGMVYFHQGKLKEAEGEFKKVLELDNSYGLAYYSLGLVYDEQERLNSASSNYQKALLLMPDHGPSHYELGVVYFKKRNFEFALSEWEKALMLEEENYKFVHASMGIVYEELKMDNRAWKEYELAIRYNPSDVNSLFRLGILMMREGLYEDALINLNEVIALEKKGEIVDKTRDYVEIIQNILKEEEKKEHEDNETQDKENQEEEI